MKKIDFVNGTTIDGAKTFNDMQNNVEEVFNGEEAMGSIVVEDITSNNLFNPNDVFAGKWLDENGQPMTGNTNDILTNFIKVKPNTKYTISGFISTEQYLIVGSYNSSKTFNSMLLPSQVSSTQTISFTTNATDEYIRCAFSDVNMGSETLQIEKGDATLYKPHKEFSNKQIYSSNEQIIGTLMGKPLYQKTYETTSTTVNLSAEPYDLLFVHEAVIELSTGATFTMGRYINTTDFFTTYAYKNNNIVSIDLGSTWIMSKGFITVRYTKTTDIGTSTSSISTTSLEEGE